MNSFTYYLFGMLSIILPLLLFYIFSLLFDPIKTFWNSLFRID